MKTITTTGNRWRLFVDVRESEIDGLSEVVLQISTAEGSSFEFVGLLCRQFLPGTNPSDSTVAAGKALMRKV